MAKYKMDLIWQMKRSVRDSLLTLWSRTPSEQDWKCVLFEVQ